VKPKILLGLALAIFLFCLFGACKRKTTVQRSSSANGNQPATAGPASSAYGWTLENSQRVKLSDYQGKVVVLDFYATWCEPCRAETPHLVKMQQQYGPQGLQVIGLNVGGEDDLAEVPAFAKEFSIPYPLGTPEDEFVDEYLSDNQNIPQSFVFDRNGRMVKRFVGFNNQVEQDIETAVQASLGAAPAKIAGQ
jgi:thiol-disulfide isomerase/thioredoxin